jgi:hypothetical protein
MSRKALVQSSVVGWAILLAFVFVVFTAVASVVGTKSSGQFTTVQPPPARATQPAPGAPVVPPPVPSEGPETPR